MRESFENLSVKYSVRLPSSAREAWKAASDAPNTETAPSATVRQLEDELGSRFDREKRSMQLDIPLRDAVALPSFLKILKLHHQMLEESAMTRTRWRVASRLLHRCRFQQQFLALSC